MKRLVKNGLPLLGLLVVLVTEGRGQSWRYGIAAGPNANIIGLTSQKEVNNEVIIHPWFGVRAGAMAHKRMGKRSIFDAHVSLVHKRNRDRTRISLRDSVNNNLGRYEEKTVMMNYLAPGIAYSVQLTDIWALGLGVNVYVLLNSKTRIRDFDDPLSYKNYYFRRANFSIPLIASYETGNLLVKLRFEKGLMSRVKGGEIKERENTFTVTLGYLFGKAEAD